MFAGLALAIAVIGLYGTVLHDVARRRAEIGVRMALGARRGQVIFMVIRDVLVVVAIGVLVGIPAARGAARISESLLFGITRADVPTTVAATLMLLVAALAAAFGPAFRAARVNPGVALRDD
jgi:ABC-type antimicrobial peptide transport system permease subunit